MLKATFSRIVAEFFYTKNLHILKKSINFALAIER